MKLTLTNGTVTLTSENEREARSLIEVALKGTTPATPAPRKKHKRHAFMKPCRICGKAFKGSLGRGIHETYCRREAIRRRDAEVLKREGIIKNSVIV